MGSVKLIMNQSIPLVTGKTGWPWTSDCEAVAVRQAAENLFPKITIVTPSFNQVDYIEQTIRSVLMQGYPNLEYIIIDGGSTDGSVEIIKKYEPWLAYWESKQDHGQTHALNKGFRRATGDWLAWLNSDDLYLPGGLFTVAENIRSGKNCHWIVGVTALSADAVQVDGYFEPVCNTDSWLDFVCTKTDTGTALPQPSSFWSREAWQKTGLLNETLHYIMDHEYWCRLAQNGFRPLCISDNLAIFRNHDTSKSFGGVINFYEEELRVFDQWISGSSESDKKSLVMYKELLAFNIRNEKKRLAVKEGIGELSEGIELSHIRCRSCGSKNLKFIDQCRQFDTVTKYEMCLAHVESLDSGNLYRCDECGLGMRLPGLLSASLEEMNLNVSSDDWDNEKDIFENNVAWVRAKKSIMSKFSSGYSPRVLDIGCYTGKFLRGLPSDWHKFAIEPNQATHAKLKKNNIVIIDPDDTNVHQSFDAVCLFDVFEHVLDPFKLLDDAMEYVKDGGVLIVSTGNLDSWSWRLLKGEYWYLDSPLHLSFATPDFFYHLCRKQNEFKISSIVKQSHTKAPIIEKLKNIAEVVYFWLRKRNGLLVKLMKRIILGIPIFSYLKHKEIFPFTFFIRDHLFVEISREFKE